MDNKPHILVVDDDDRLRALVGRYLRENGFAVSQAADARHARALLGLFAFDLMVLDVMMPGESGLQLTESLREAGAPPILMLSARTQVDDRVGGLEVGADDYLTKPFEPKELVLRIRAVLRRAAPPPAPGRVRFGEFAFDMEGQRLERQGLPVYLTSSEAELLKILAEHMGQSVSREMLARALKLPKGNERGVDVQITRLRKKVEAEGARPQFIQTVRGEGYRLQGSRG